MKPITNVQIEKLAKIILLGFFAFFCFLVYKWNTPDAQPTEIPSNTEIPSDTKIPSDTETWLDREARLHPENIERLKKMKKTAKTPRIIYTCDDYEVTQGALSLLGLENESIRDITTMFSSERGCSCKGYIHRHKVYYNVEYTDAGRPILTANTY